MIALAIGEPAHLGRSWPHGDTGPTVSRFSAHTATELVTVGPVSAVAGITPWNGVLLSKAPSQIGRHGTQRGRLEFDATSRRSAG